jgi:hypothetical protein
VNLAALRTELKARGFDFLSDTRCNSFLNEAYHSVCEWNGTPWPFLETTTTGTAPLTISDLREIVYVTNTSLNEVLEPEDIRNLNDWNPGLTLTGTPVRYYLDGTTTLKVWPASTSASLSVRYLKVPTDLSSDSDSPVIPARFHPLVVDMAEVLAYQDASDFQEAEAKRQLLEIKLGRMRDTLNVRQDDEPSFIQVTRNDDQGPYWCP